MEKMIKPPTKEETKQARLDAKLNQTDAAALVYKNLRSWQKWEAGDRQMDPAVFELFLIKTGQLDKIKS